MAMIVSAAVLIIAVFVTLSIRQAGIQLTEPYIGIPLLVVILVAFSVLIRSIVHAFWRRNLMTSDTDGAGAHTTEVEVRRRASSSALSGWSVHRSFFREFLGAAAMIGLSFGLISVLRGALHFEGSFDIEGLGVPYILAAAAIIQFVYHYQQKVALIRPSGGRTGWWFSILDISVSLPAAILSTIILAGVVTRWLPDAGIAFWQTYLSLIPFPPYTPTALVVGVVGTFYGWQDVRNQFHRAEHGRETLVQRQVARVMPADQQVIAVAKGKVPHGYAIFARKPNGAIDFDGGNVA
ncbi:hypothetical protein C4568_00340 [Candidatus Parcubacteria bacterium]|nr:MAG: hypothetical protein C4568_00340 [Candidatus Parcubacteria bacterium]